jgi:hypothetical protein
MTMVYETQDVRAVARRARGAGFVWRCHQCGRYLGTIERVDGVLEIRHHCGAVNLLRGTLATSAVDTASEPE